MWFLCPRTYSHRQRTALGRAAPCTLGRTQGVREQEAIWLVPPKATGTEDPHSEGTPGECIMLSTPDINTAPDMELAREEMETAARLQRAIFPY